jgi:energy-converting hydrogenase A subunit M
MVFPIVIKNVQNTDAHHSTVHNSQAMETAQTALQLMKDQENVVLTYTMELCSAIKKDETRLFADKCRELEDIILSKVSLVQKDKGHIIPLICGR